MDGIKKEFHIFPLVLYAAWEKENIALCYWRITYIL